MENRRLCLRSDAPRASQWPLRGLLHRRRVARGVGRAASAQAEVGPEGWPWGGGGPPVTFTSQHARREGRHREAGVRSASTCGLSRCRATAFGLRLVSLHTFACFPSPPPPRPPPARRSSQSATVVPCLRQRSLSEAPSPMATGLVPRHSGGRKDGFARRFCMSACSSRFAEFLGSRRSQVANGCSPMALVIRLIARAYKAQA